MHEHEPIFSPIQNTNSALGHPAELTLKDRINTALSEVNEGLDQISSIEDVQEIAFGIMDELPESREISTELQRARQDRNSIKETELVQKQKNIYSNLVEELALIAGIETDQGRVERENAEYRIKLGDLFDDSSLVSDSSDDLLMKIGMLEQDSETSNLRFNFPEKVFPPHVKEKWDHYIDIVARHTSAILERSQGGAGAKDPSFITQLDVIRTHAHNNLSMAIKNFLVLDGWDLEKCRNLVIKMRDKKLPTIETAESHVTARSVRLLLFELKGIVDKPTK
ncbi:hypothetical protein EB118_07465 [bacterium]|nr:hypothetical protein [bacterium]NBX98241.1 hypothetical protein [bacterium]NDC94649.1 hypothetical protein [bacterium]NDD84271.1 hypothetical protein [bacterium]NDG29919.1 hypothetical protein [bacterium]